MLKTYIRSILGSPWLSLMLGCPSWAGGRPINFLWAFPQWGPTSYSQGTVLVCTMAPWLMAGVLTLWEGLYFLWKFIFDIFYDNMIMIMFSFIYFCCPLLWDNIHFILFSVRNMFFYIKSILNKIKIKACILFHLWNGFQRKSNLEKTS